MDRLTAAGSPWQWYDRTMPADWKLTPAEWDWFCYRSQRLRVNEVRRAEEAKGKPVAKGATAGWRQEKRVEAPITDAPSPSPGKVAG